MKPAGFEQTIQRAIIIETRAESSYQPHVIRFSEIRVRYDDWSRFDGGKVTRKEGAE